MEQSAGMGASVLPLSELGRRTLGGSEEGAGDREGLARSVSVFLGWTWKGVVAESTWNGLGLGELGVKTEKSLSPVKPHAHASNHTPAPWLGKTPGYLHLTLARRTPSAWWSSPGLLSHWPWGLKTWPSSVIKMRMQV